MNHTDRLHRALADQADAIGLRPADADAVMRRGTARRTRRRAAVVGVAALAVVAGSLAVVERGQPDATVESGLAASVVPSPFDWTVVSPGTGLGYAGPATVLDGTLYRLSTAPGVPAADASWQEPRHLYRSGDGAEWSEVSLPDGLRPSSLAASGGALYAVGTAPAGGDAQDLVVAASSDGAATWQTVTLPDDVAALEARHPGEIVIGRPSVAAMDATHIVTSVVVSAAPDVEALLPGVADRDAGWEVTPEGVTVYEAVPCGESGVPCGDGGRASTTMAPSADGADVARVEAGEPHVAGTYSWDELGLDPELRALIAGRAYVYASDDGATFQRVELPDGLSGWGGQVVAAEDGYRLFLGTSDAGAASTRVLRSLDGRAWQAAGTLPGAPASTGLLAGRPAVSLFDDDGGARVQVSQPDGSWLPLELAQAVTGDAESTVLEVAFGPLGAAATVMAGDGPDDVYLVHSADGSSLSAVRLSDHLQPPVGGTLGLDVSADAITVRVSVPNDDDASTPPTQQVLVGTPR